MIRKLFLLILIFCLSTTHLFAGGVIDDWTTGTKSSAGKIYAQDASDAKHGCGFEFIAVQNGLFTNIQFYVKRFDNADPGPTGYLTAQLYTVDGSHLPSVRLGESTTKLDVSTILTSDGWQNFDFSPAISLTSGTHYICMLERPTTGDAFTGDVDNYIGEWGADKAVSGITYKIQRNKDDVYKATYRNDYPWHQTGATRPARRVMTIT